MDRADLTGRWTTICVTVRNWAIANPNEYALIYGSPVPGYVAPADTVGPASRVSVLLVQILADSAGAAQILTDPTAPSPRLVSLMPWQAALDPVRAAFPAGLPDSVIQTGLMVWSGLFGAISFELFGQFHNVIGDQPGDRAAFFAECVRRWADQLHLPG